MIRAMLCAAALSGLAAPAAAATLIVNANGYDVDAQGKLQRFGGMLVADDGRIAALLRPREREPKLAEGDLRFDAGGRTLLPGLIAAHVRLVDYGRQLRRTDLAQAGSVAEIIAALRAAAPANGARRWLVARNWQPEAAVSAADLDAAFPGRPVWIVAADGVNGVASGAALADAGISRTTPDPRGGRIGRDAAGNPTGQMIGTAVALVEAQQPPASAGERELALAAALAHMAEMGVTGVQDFATSVADWALYRSFADRGALSLRITAYADGVAAMETISPLRPTPWLYDGRLKLQGIAFRADGHLADHGAWLQAPYADAPDLVGRQLLDDAKAKNLLSRANFLGFQAAVHAEGDAAVRQILDGFAEIAPAYGTGFRNRIEHQGPLPASATDRLAQLGLAAVIAPWDAAARATAAARLGPARLAALAPLAALRGAGVPVALRVAHTPRAAPLPSLAEFAGAAGAAGADGAAGDAFATALAGVTANAAIAGGSAREAGRLQPGFRADFILLDSDPFLLPPGAVAGLKVAETWVGGKRVFARGTPAGGAPLPAPDRRDLRRR